MLPTLPSRPGDRVKTDRRDARRLAAQYQGGMLGAIHVLSPEQEALRDLVRACEDARHDRMRARRRLCKLSLNRAIPRGQRLFPPAWHTKVNAPATVRSRSVSVARGSTALPKSHYRR